MSGEVDVMCRFMGMPENTYTYQEEPTIPAANTGRKRPGTTGPAYLRLGFGLAESPHERIAKVIIMGRFNSKHWSKQTRCLMTYSRRN